MNVYNNNWLGKNLNVISSQDSTLVGRQGMVIDESQKTITIKEDGKVVKLGKASIKFTITLCGTSLTCVITIQPYSEANVSSLMIDFCGRSENVD